MIAEGHTNSVEGTQNQRTNLVFSEGRRIESDFNMNRSVVQIEDFVVRASRLDNIYSAYFLGSVLGT